MRQQQQYRRHALRWAAQAGAMAITSLSGCSMMPWVDTSAGASSTALIQESTRVSTTPARHADPLLDFLATAAPGQSRELTDPNSNAPLRITAGELYAAASGRQCRNYRTTPANNPRVVQWGLACNDEQTGWSTKPMRVNPSLTSTQ